jgi:hypothetical protein
MHALQRKIIAGILGPILFGMTLGCATSFSNPQLQLTEESDYYSTVEMFSDKKQIYDGLYQTLEVSAAILNSKVIKYQVDQNARIYQWNSNQYADEKSKAQTLLAKRTDVFLSFFTPDRKNDDLNKPKTKWKVFLDVNGKRYEGKVEKIKAEYAEILSLYRLHSRWCTPYRVIFDVPVGQIEAAASKLTLTGPVGSAAIDFKGL